MSYRKIEYANEKREMTKIKKLRKRKVNESQDIHQLKQFAVIITILLFILVLRIFLISELSKSWKKALIVRNIIQIEIKQKHKLSRSIRIYKR